MILQEIEELRRRLLDLTPRNRLLSFDHERTSCLRVVDELPDQLFTRLRAGDKLYIDPLPQPTPQDLARLRAEDGPDEETPTREPAPKVWAKHLGIDGSFELPAAGGAAVSKHHADKRIQTLLYREKLEARLRKLRGDAELAIQESGSNILFLAFGFLQWPDRPDAASSAPSAHLAPLLLVPVALSRVVQAGKSRWQLEWTGEDLEANLSLQRKLEDMVGVALPGLADPADAESELAPEAYFQKAAEATSMVAGCGVKRHVTLALFHFAKQLLYRDLDRARWPADHRLEERPLVRHFLGTAPEPTPAAEPAELAAVIDLDLQLVDRADSSQAKAIVRALAGEDHAGRGAARHRQVADHHQPGRSRPGGGQDRPLRLREAGRPRGGAASPR